MANKRGRVSNGAQVGNGDGVGSWKTEQLLERLELSFAEFRRTHRTGARIPQTLRDATLAAIARGASESAVIRACGITQMQLDLWRECPGEGKRGCSSNDMEPLVFPVVEDGADLGPPGFVGGDGGSDCLQFRVGQWEISIRPTGR